MFASNAFVAELLDLTIEEVADLASEIGIDDDCWDVSSIDDAIAVLESDDDSDQLDDDDLDDEDE